MLSILIPTYNYDITGLVSEIHKQAIEAKIEFEIICLDDDSNDEIISTNKLVNDLTNTYYLLSKQNKGIAITRQLLVNKAKYEWIILLDADVKLKNDFFIFNYLEALKNECEVFFGGISYEKKLPNCESILRWKYGKRYEEVSAEKRNIKPYKITSAANILIKKAIYNRFSLDNIGNLYGMDIFFGPQLKLNKIPVLHINNSIYHLGLESSIKYLNKIDLAVKTLINLHYQHRIDLHENDLLKTFLWSKKIRLNYVFSFLHKLFSGTIKNNLLSNNPNMFLLQLYKITYICFQDLNQNKTL